MRGSIRSLAAAGAALLAVGGSSAGPAHGFSGDFLHGTTVTKPPMGYTQFCRNNPEDCLDRDLTPSLVDLTAGRFGELDAVNRSVNESIRPVTDLNLYGVEEFWTYPTVGAGDCEEYVLVKRRTLMELGWPAQSLLITVVLDQNGAGHAVLTAHTNGGDLILDNQAPNLKLWHETGYRFIKRQAERNPNEWTALGPVPDGSSHITASH